MTAFCRLDELGLEIVGQRLEPERAVLACRVVEPDDWRRRCGCQGVPRDTVTRALAHEPLGWRPTTLEVTVRRYRCTGCGACVAPRHLRNGRAAGEAVPAWAVVSAGRHRVPAPDRSSCRRQVNVSPMGTSGSGSPVWSPTSLVTMVSCPTTASVGDYTGSPASPRCSCGAGSISPRLSGSSGGCVSNFP